jgi:hypothetical protein
MRTLGDAIDTSVWNVGYGQAGKNKIINGAFDNWQRGTSFTLATGVDTYCADRFLFAAYGSSTAGTVTRQTFTPGAAPVAGYESQYFARLTNFATASAWQIRQRIENVQTYAGQTVTFSYYAKTSTAISNLHVEIRQVFGSGGSTGVNTTVTASAAISTSWVRYSHTVVVPSISGKTIGSGSFLEFNFYQPSGATNSGTIDIWGWQVEYGSKATPFQTASGGSIQGELAMCQRYYQRITGNTNNPLAYGANSTTSVHRSYIYFPVEMRTAPTALEQSGTASDYAINQFSVGVTTCTALITFFESSNKSILVSNSVAAATLTTFQPGGIRANATGAFLGWSAEL